MMDPLSAPIFKDLSEFTVNDLMISHAYEGWTSICRIKLIIQIGLNVCPDIFVGIFEKRFLNFTRLSIRRS